MRLVNNVAGKRSRWKIIEKEFIQGKDVSKFDAWKLILLSDLFPKVRHYQMLVIVKVPSPGCKI